ncbi:MAG: ribonuclease P protein component [Phycisphaerales bacterium]|nr:ribonuclease P protein component [Planctomycetota bacterium]MCH8509973.1 ribonuclease P protein component [Phycisphaerales bacterium]
MPQHPFRARHRLSLDRDYKAVFANRVTKARGPLTVFMLPSDRPEHRLGLSIGRRVGNAVARVRLKRMIREAFRLDRPVYPMSGEGMGYDIIVSGRAHKPLPLNEYRRLLREAIEAGDRACRKRTPEPDQAGTEP